MIEVVSLRPKTYAYLIHGYNDNDYEKIRTIKKKTKWTRKCVIKQKLMFENCKDCFFNNKAICRSLQRFKSYYHNVYKEEVNKIALSSNDDKILQRSDRITTHPYGKDKMMLINK